MASRIEWAVARAIADFICDHDRCDAVAPYLVDARAAIKAYKKAVKEKGE